MPIIPPPPAAPPPVDDFSFGGEGDSAFDFSAGGGALTGDDPFGFSNLALSGFNPVSPLKQKGPAAKPPGGAVDPFALP